MALTETELKGMRHDPTRDFYKADGAGLFIRVQRTGTMAWVWRHKESGKTNYVTLGKWPDLPLKDARKALERRTGTGAPPKDLKVKDALALWFDARIALKYRDTHTVRVYVNRISSALGNIRLTELKQNEIEQFVAAYARKSPVASTRCLSMFKLALRWFCKKTWLAVSPAMNLDREDAGGKETTRSRTLSDEEIRRIWHLESPHSHVLRALLLTGCRIRELQMAMRGHIEGDWLWLPAKNTKSKRTHRVYLMPETREQFNGQGDALFTATHRIAVQKHVRALQSDPRGKPREDWLSIRPIDRETGERDERCWTPHDIRRTYVTKLNELGVAPHVVERLVNHALVGVQKTYNRSELLVEREEATRLWAAELARIVQK